MINWQFSVQKAEPIRTAVDPSSNEGPRQYMHSLTFFFDRYSILVLYPTRACLSVRNSLVNKSDFTPQKCFSPHCDAGTIHTLYKAHALAMQRSLIISKGSPFPTLWVSTANNTKQMLHLSVPVKCKTADGVEEFDMTVSLYECSA